MESLHKDLIKLLGLEQTVSPETLAAFVRKVLSKNKDLRTQAAEKDIENAELKAIVSRLENEIAFEISKSKYYFKRCHEPTEVKNENVEG